MIDPEDNGRRLAEEVVSRVVDAHPTVAVEWIQTTGYHGTVVRIADPEVPRSSVLLYANFDWSFQLEWGRRILFEDEPMEGTEAVHVERIAHEILKIVGPHEPGAIRRSY